MSASIVTFVLVFVLSHHFFRYSWARITVYLSRMCIVDGGEASCSIGRASASMLLLQFLLTNLLSIHRICKF